MGGYISDNSDNQEEPRVPLGVRKLQKKVKELEAENKQLREALEWCAIELNLLGIPEHGWVGHEQEEKGMIKKILKLLGRE